MERRDQSGEAADGARLRPAINPMGVEGQLEGSMLLAYGYAMFEIWH